VGDPGTSATHDDRSALVAGYEALRRAVLGGQPEGWRLGHGVLANAGMAGWVATWTALAPPAAGTTAPPSSPFTPTPSVSTPDPTPTLSSLPNAGEIVAVLAQMALAHL
jgi:hypothetical protein